MIFSKDIEGNRFAYIWTAVYYMPAPHSPPIKKSTLGDFRKYLDTLAPEHTIMPLHLYICVLVQVQKKCWICGKQWNLDLTPHSAAYDLGLNP